MKKNTTIIAAVAVVAIIVVAAAAVVLVNNGGDNGDKPFTPVTLTDAVGREVTIDSVPTRALVTSTMEVESMIYMGLGDLIAGVNGDKIIYTEYSDTIIGVKSYGKGVINSMSALQKAVDSGKVAYLDPTWHQTAETLASKYQEGDIIIFGYSSYGYSGIGDQLDKLGLKYFVCPYATDMQGVYDDIEILGKIFGVEKTAQNLIDNCKSIISDVGKLVKSLKAPSFAVTSGSYGYGSGYILGSIAEELGGINALGITEKYKQISAEDVVQGNPQVVFETSAGGMGGSPLIDPSSPVFKDLDFVKNNKLFSVGNNTGAKYGTAYRALTTTSPHLVETYLMFVVALYGDQLGIEVPNNVFTDDYQKYLQMVVDKI